MTTPSYTRETGEKLQPSDADRLAQLSSAEQDCVLSREERDEIKVLGRREAARAIAEGFYHIAGIDHATETAFHDLRTGLALANSDSVDTRVLGYVVALQSLIRAPDALATALRLLRDELLATAPQLDHALRVFARDLEARHGEA